MVYKETSLNPNMLKLCLMIFFASVDNQSRKQASLNELLKYVVDF